MEKIATQYAVRIMASKTIEELTFIGAEIKAYLDKDADFKAGWRSWLIDIWQSQYDTLSAPKLVPEECLNKSGLKALARGDISL